MSSSARAFSLSSGEGPPFQIQLLDLLQTRMRELYPENGLNELLWHLDVDDRAEAGPAQPPTLPDLDDYLDEDGELSKAQEMKFKMDHAQFLRYGDAVQASLKEAFGIMSPALKMVLSDPQTGTSMVTLERIFEVNRTRYCAPTKDRLSQLVLAAQSPMGSDPAAQLAAHAHVIKTFEAMGQPLPAFLQMAYLETAAATNPTMTTAIRNYETANPVFANRSYEDMALAISNHLDNTAPTMGSFAGGASGATAPSVPHVPKPPWTGPPRAPAGAPPAAKPPAPPYCWYHGCTGHTGMNCKHMASWEPAYRQAKTPVTINGVQGHIV